MMCTNLLFIGLVDPMLRRRDGVKSQLKSPGFIVVFEVESGREALDKIGESTKLPDVCVIRDDFEAAIGILKAYPDLKVLVISSREERDSVMDLLRAGISGYVLPSGGPAELIAAIKILGSQGRFFSSRISHIATRFFDDMRIP